MEANTSSSTLRVCFFLVLGAVVSTLFGGMVGSLIYVYWGGLLLSCVVAFKREIDEVKYWVRMRQRERRADAAGTGNP